MGNAGTSTAAHTESGIIPMKYNPDPITQTPALTQKIRAAVVFFILSPKHYNFDNP
jgi:hypothetical protein